MSGQYKLYTLALRLSHETYLEIDFQVDLIYSKGPSDYSESPK